jgi:hypothetical protein
VRGVIELCDQYRQNSFQIRKHVVVPETHDPKAIFREPPIAPLISFRPGVLAAINFQNQSLFEAEEVGDVGSNRDLTPKLERLEPAIPQRKPKLPFGIGHT